MAVIDVHATAVTQEGWVFQVELTDQDGQTQYRVSVGRADYERFTGGAVPPDALVRATFRFLLAREPKEAILREFDLSVVERYFPEAETELRRQWQS